MPSDGVKIQFLAPDVVDGEIEVEIDDKDIVSEVKIELILFAIRGDLTMAQLKWNSLLSNILPGRGCLWMQFLYSLGICSNYSELCSCFFQTGWCL